jgi:L-fuconolactonase
MYGGDWPISVAAGGYDHVFAGLEEVLSDLSDADRARIWSGTAREFYRIDPARLAAASGGAHR